ncbi:MAG: lytic transglycosylase domain-containing protein, partial [Clostridiales bacterium]|nr:lytic transglycosylase domain-containing protein [Clostridiales bacterium]
MTNINGVSNIINPADYESNKSKVNQIGNETFASYLNEEKSLDDIFEEASKKYNVPLNLLKAIGKAESDFNPKAVSKSGAQGVMQLMPGTAKELGVTDSFDPEQNIMGGSKYISDLLKRYDGDTKLALAAYNAGMGNVKKYGGIPPFKETQNYVVKVMQYMEEDLTAGSVGVESTTRTFTRTSMDKTLSKWHTAPAYPTGKIDRGQGSGSSMANLLDILFSYDDYMRFIEIFSSSIR